MSALSASFIYTVEGSVTGIYGNGPSVDALGFSYGDNITYQFLVDTERSGFVKYADGSIEYIDDFISGDSSYVRFYAELVNMPYTVNDTYYNWGRTYYLAQNIDDPAYSSPVGSVIVGPDMLRFGSSAYIQDWQLGDDVFGAHNWHDSVTGEYITLHSQLNITEISSVPLPSSLFLLASSFTVLLRLSKRNNERT